VKRCCCWPGDWRWRGRRWNWRAAGAAARRIENSTRLGRLVAASRSTEAGLIAWFRWACQARGASGCRLSAKSTAVIDGPASHALRRGSTTGNIVSAPAAECQRSGLVGRDSDTLYLLSRLNHTAQHCPTLCVPAGSLFLAAKTCRGKSGRSILKPVEIDFLACPPLRVPLP
jgi:hypothetical protein